MGGPNVVRSVFWPVARAAYLRVRLHAGLLVEMVHTAVVRDVRWGNQYGIAANERAWLRAQAFVAHRCVTSLSDAAAERFIDALLLHCARHERGSKFRDELKSLCLKEKTQQGLTKAYSVGAFLIGSTASAAKGVAGMAADAAASSVDARGTAAGLSCGVRSLLRDIFNDGEDTDES